MLVSGSSRKPKLGWTARYRFLLGQTGNGLRNTEYDQNATIDWHNRLSWRRTNDLSVDYDVDILRLPRVRPENQVTGTVVTRYSFGS